MTLKVPEYSPLMDYWRNELMRQLFTESWLYTHNNYKVPDTRPRWKRALSRIRLWFYWRTIGRFKAWLHRDCGEY